MSVRIPCAAAPESTRSISISHPAQWKSRRTLRPTMPATLLSRRISELCTRVEEGVSSDDLTPSVAAYEIVEGGALRLRNRLPIPGLSPCHIAASPDGRWLVTSNYSDGSNTVVAVDGGDGDGALLRVVHQSINGGEVGPHERQDAPHAHFAQFIDQSPTALRILSCDLGLDRLVALELNPATGILSVLADEGASLPASVGPRHFAAHPTLPYLYVFGELDSTVYVFRKERQGGPDKHATLNQLQAVSTLPEDFAGANLGAAIRVSPDGQRGHCPRTEGGTASHPFASMKTPVCFRRWARCPAEANGRAISSMSGRVSLSPPTSAATTCRHFALIQMARRRPLTCLRCG